MLVGDEPITSPDDARFLLEHLKRQKEIYRTEAKYSTDGQRDRMMQLFDRAIVEIEPQAKG